jgi:hypothetical protein
VLFRWECNIYPMQWHTFLNIVIDIDTKRRPLPLSWGSPPPHLRAGVGLSHRTQIQRYEDGDPKDKGFRPGGRRSFDSWQVGVSIDSLLFNTAGYFSNVK